MSFRTFALKGISNSIKVTRRVAVATKNASVTAGKATKAFAIDAKSTAKQAWNEDIS